MRAEEHLRAIGLREKGYSYNHISSILNISKSTLSDWLSKIPYTPNAETIQRIGKARAASGAIKSQLRRESTRLASEEARRQLGRVTRRDLFMIGLGLYIGEGSKTAEITRFVNSDPAVVNLMIRWFTEALGVPRLNLRMRLHLYPDCDERQSLRYWSKITNIPMSQFQRTSFDRRTNKKAAKIGKLIYGTAHLSLNSLGNKRFGVFLFRKIVAWSEALLQGSTAGLV